MVAVAVVAAAAADAGARVASCNKHQHSPPHLVLLVCCLLLLMPPPPPPPTSQVSRCLWLLFSSFAVFANLWIGEQLHRSHTCDSDGPDGSMDAEPVRLHPKVKRPIDKVFWWLSIPDCCSLLVWFSWPVLLMSYLCGQQAKVLDKAGKRRMRK